MFDGGDSNLYGYVLQDPVNFVDPEGLEQQYVYSQRGVHHLINSATARDLNMSQAAIKHLNNHNFNVPLYNTRHMRSGGVSHFEYNERVKAVCEKWFSDNKITPANMTVQDADRLIKHIRYSKDPKIVMFNRPLFVRHSIMSYRYQMIKYPMSRIGG